MQVQSQLATLRQALSTFMMGGGGNISSSNMNNTGWNSTSSLSMGGSTSGGWGNTSSTEGGFNNNNTGLNATTSNMTGGSGWGNTSTSSFGGSGAGFDVQSSGNSSSAAMKNIRLAMINLYTKVDPSKIRKLDATLLKYQSKLNEYVTRIMKKYGNRMDVQPQLQQLSSAIRTIPGGATSTNNFMGGGGGGSGMNSMMNSSFAPTGW